jgi:RNA polymerase sigma-70 factor, ECF subfamily
MHTTSPSLLERLRRPEAREDWARFVDLYAPLLFYWSQQAGLHEPDAADVAQDVLLTLMEKLPGFTYDPGRSFRKWLRQVTQNKCREWFRKEALRRGTPLTDLADSGTNDPAVTLAEDDYQAHILRQAMVVMQRDFQPLTWQACWEYLVNGKPATEVAAQLGMTPNAVYIAKARVLKQLRQELEGLLD